MMHDLFHIHLSQWKCLFLYLGEKLSDEEVNELLVGHEDAQGNVNYEGINKMFCCVFHKC